MRVPGDDDDRRVDAARSSIVELAISTSGSTTQPAPITETLPEMTPLGSCADLERLVADDDRVPGIGPALVTADDIRLLREQVDDLALALVAPLRADDDGRRHCAQSSLTRSVGGSVRRGASCARDAAHDDAVAAPAGGEADVGVAAQRPAGTDATCVGRPATRPRRARHASQGTSKLVASGPDPDVLAVDHAQLQLPLRRAREAGRPVDAAHDELVAGGAADEAPTSSAAIEPRTRAARIASRNSSPAARAASRHGSHRHENDGGARRDPDRRG